MKALSVALKDMQVFFKDRGGLMELFVLPLVFVLIFVGLNYAMAGGEDEDEADNRIALQVVNLDPGGDRVQSLLDELDSRGGLRVELVEQAEGEQSLKEGEIARLLTVPAGFSADLAAGDRTTLALVHGSDNAQENETAQTTIQGVVRDLSIQQDILAGLEQMRAMGAANDATEDVFTAELAMAQASGQYEASRERPLVVVSQIKPRTYEERGVSDFNPVQVGVPGTIVLFVFLTAQTTARSIHDEKKTGSFRRLLAAPLSKSALLVGKMLPNLIKGILQVLVVFAAGAYLFPLIGLDQLTFGSDPLALGLLVLLVVLCSSGMGVLIAAIARTEAQIGGFSQALLWAMAFIGGSIIPTFLVNDTLAAIGRVTPQGWANVAFYDLLVRGLGLQDVAGGLLALLGFTLAFFLVGMWRFEFE